MSQPRNTVRAIAFSAFVLLGLPVAGSAQEFAPPPPSAKSKDWVKMTSGEWLRGEIHWLRDDDLEFDSEEFEVLTLDWDDVAELVSPRALTYSFVGDIVFTGTARMKDGVIKVRSDGTLHEFSRHDVISIIEGTGSEWDFWSGKVSVGFVGRAGNTDQTDMNALVFFRRDAAKTRLDFNYAGNLGELNGEQNVNNHLGGATLNLFLSRGVFVTPVGLELYADEFQNIDLRLSVAAGVGIFVVRTKPLEWFFELGAGYLHTQYISVEPGQESIDNSASLIPITSLDWNATDDIELNLSYNATIGMPEAKNTYHHVVALFDIDVIGILDFTTSITWDRVETPKPRADGSVPARDDFRTAFGLGIDL